MAKLTDLHEYIWKDGWAKRYPDDPEETRQIIREKRIQREIDERARRHALGIGEDKEQPRDPKESA
jgi:hypothetical protein